MSLAALTTALDALDEPACCEGTYKPTERLAIMLPDGDVAAAAATLNADPREIVRSTACFGDGGFDASTSSVLVTSRIQQQRLPQATATWLAGNGNPSDPDVA